METRELGAKAEPMGRRTEVYCPRLGGWRLRQGIRTPGRSWRLEVQRRRIRRTASADRGRAEGLAGTRGDRVEELAGFRRGGGRASLTWSDGALGSGSVAMNGSVAAGSGSPSAVASGSGYEGWLVSGSEVEARDIILRGADGEWRSDVFQHPLHENGEIFLFSRFKVQGSRFFIIRHIHNHTSIISSEMQVELKKNTTFT